MEAYNKLIEKNKEVVNFIDINLKHPSFKFKTNDILSEVMYRYIIENLKDFVDFEEHFIGGVYFIEDFYIGRTKDITKRIANHITDLFVDYNGRNREKCLKIEEIISKGNKIKVKQLSKRQDDEEMFIRKYSKEIELTNIEFNDYNVRTFMKFIPNKQEEIDISIILTLDKLKDILNIIKINNNVTFKPISDYTIVIKNTINNNVYIYQRKDSVCVFKEMITKGINDNKLMMDINKTGIDNFYVEFRYMINKKIVYEELENNFNIITRKL